MVFYITFKPQGRTGNIIIQYLMCKIFTIKYGHKYIQFERDNETVNELMQFPKDNPIHFLKEDEAFEYLQKNATSNENIEIFGYFQKSEILTLYRKEILKLLYDEPNEDFWYMLNDNNKDEVKPMYFKDFLNYNDVPILTTFVKTYCNVVLSIRLDDFIQLPCKTSDILPPQYYILALDNILKENMDIGKKVNIYIVCEKIEYDWEKHYINYLLKGLEFCKRFRKIPNVNCSWVILQNCNIYHDCALFRECDYLIHSNSTLCWSMSFLSRNPDKKRVIPYTNFYSTQKLYKIEETDILKKITPLTHEEVFNINIQSVINDYHSLSYCIPDEYVVSIEEFKYGLLSKIKRIEKTNYVCENVPNYTKTYKYGAGQEKEYLQSYKQSNFAITSKKCGWDCLRHYEIMASGCVPVFKDIESCPEATLTTLPKELLKEANLAFEDIRKTANSRRNVILKYYYERILTSLLEHIKENCTTSKCAEYILSKIKIPNTSASSGSTVKNILLITCDSGINYTRELSWIGLKRYIQSIGGVAVEYPKIHCLYDDYEGNLGDLYGNGYVYTKKLKNDYDFTRDEIIDNLNNKFFDLVIFGKVGPDELELGTLPRFDLWEEVIENYNRNQIVFFYGGDHIFDMRPTLYHQSYYKTYNETYDYVYKNHLNYHLMFGKCFVRELIKPPKTETTK